MTIHQIKTDDIILHGPEGVRVIPLAEAYYSRDMYAGYQAMARQKEMTQLAGPFKEIVDKIKEGGGT